MQNLYKKVDMQEGEMPPFIAVRTDTYVDDTNKNTKDNQYPWLDKDDKKMKNVRYKKT